MSAPSEKLRAKRRKYAQNYLNDGRSVREYRAGRRSTSEMMLMQRSDLPAEPCFPCGARGWCEHRQPDLEA
jgi:hypothetical protein